MGVDWSDTDIQRAVIQGLITGGSVIISAAVTVFLWFSTRRKEISERHDLRNERRSDLMLAIWADIRPIWIDLTTQGTLKEKHARVKMSFAKARSDGDSDYVPFVTKVSGTLLDERLIRDVDVLESSEIETIVPFYHQIRIINQMATDMRSDRYQSLPLERKEAVLADLFRMEERARKLAEDALLSLENALDLRDRSGARKMYKLKSELQNGKA